MTTKICTQCHLEKDLESFSIHNGFKDGRNSKCKSCKTSNQRKGYKDGRYKATPWTYEKHLKEKYGLSFEEFTSMLETQIGLCKICLLPMDKPNVDHCHLTGKIRGLLCVKCNTGLGKFNDDPELLKVALQYLIENK